MKVLPLFLAFVIGGFAAPALSSPLSGRTFQAVTIDGDTVKSANAPTLVFDRGRVSGSGGCNRFGATAADNGLILIERTAKRPPQRVAKGALRFGPISSTRKHCGPGSALESRFFYLLGMTRAYRMGASELRLYSAGSRPRVLMVLRRAN
jgi:heat shock protein HslJ